VVVTLESLVLELLLSVRIRLLLEAAWHIRRWLVAQSEEVSDIPLRRVDRIPRLAPS
jgi:hypothetical protein